MDLLYRFFFLYEFGKKKIFEPSKRKTRETENNNNKLKYK